MKKTIILVCIIVSAFTACDLFPYGVDGKKAAISVTVINETDGLAISRVFIKLSPGDGNAAKEMEKSIDFPSDGDRIVGGISGIGEGLWSLSIQIFGTESADSRISDSVMEFQAVAGTTSKFNTSLTSNPDGSVSTATSETSEDNIQPAFSFDSFDAFSISLNGGSFTEIRYGFGAKALANLENVKHLQIIYPPDNIFSMGSRYLDSGAEFSTDQYRSLLYGAPQEWRNPEGDYECRLEDMNGAAEKRTDHVGGGFEIGNVNFNETGGNLDISWNYENASSLTVDAWLVILCDDNSVVKRYELKADTPGSSLSNFNLLAAGNYSVFIIAIDAEDGENVSNWFDSSTNFSEIKIPDPARSVAFESRIRLNAIVIWEQTYTKSII